MLEASKPVSTLQNLLCCKTLQAVAIVATPDKIETASQRRISAQKTTTRTSSSAYALKNSIRNRKKKRPIARYCEGPKTPPTLLTGRPPPPATPWNTQHDTTTAATSGGVAPLTAKCCGYFYLVNPRQRGPLDFPPPDGGIEPPPP